MADPELVPEEAPQVLDVSEAPLHRHAQPVVPPVVHLLPLGQGDVVGEGARDVAAGALLAVGRITVEEVPLPVRMSREAVHLLGDPGLVPQEHVIVAARLRAVCVQHDAVRGVHDLEFEAVALVVAVVEDVLREAGPANLPVVGLGCGVGASEEGSVGGAVSGTVHV